jgi:TRAP-type transport system small permease protein
LRDEEELLSATPRSISALERLDRGFCRLNGLAVGAMLAGMLVLVFVNVIGRYFFLVSFGWIEEVSRYLMIWIVFLGAGLALREGMHVAVTILSDLSGPVRPAFKWGAWVLTFAFFLALAKFGYDYAMFASRQRSAMLQLPMWAVYLSVPIGSLLVLIHMLFDLRRGNRPDEDELVKSAS